MSFGLEHYFKSVIDYKQSSEKPIASDHEDSEIQIIRIIKVRSRVDEIIIRSDVYVFTN